MSDPLASLWNIGERYAVLTKRFESFRTALSNAGSQLSHVRIAEVEKSSIDCFDATVAGQVFRISLALENLNSTRGLLLCHAVDAASGKPGTRVAEVGFEKDMGGTATVAGFPESVSGPDGAARILAHLLLAGLRTAVSDQSGTA